MSAKVITIDGPSGAGKGTICRLVADATNFALLDSGALYRITGLACIENNIDVESEEQVAKTAANLDIRFDLVESGTKVILAGRDVTTSIREERSGMMASKVAAYPLVREALLQKQRDFAGSSGLVADGRDMGTVVFPAAPVKIFLTASSEERAKRRVKQLEESGAEADYQKVLEDIRARDEKDSSRSASPLKPADDAINLDSTAMSIGEVFDAVMNAVRKAKIIDE